MLGRIATSFLLVLEVVAIAALWFYPDKLRDDLPALLVSLAIACAALLLFLAIVRFKQHIDSHESDLSGGVLTLSLHDVTELGLVVTTVLVAIEVPQDFLALVLGAALIGFFAARVLTRSA